MKNLTISGHRIKKELKILLICFFATVLLNVFAIIYYKTNWIELISQLHIVVLLSAIIYFLAVLIRIAAWFIAGMFKLRKNK